MVDLKTINSRDLIMIDWADIYKQPFSALISHYTDKAKTIIKSYLHSGTQCGAIMGRQVDEKTGGEIPGPYLIFTDGKFAWTSKTIYHFEHYDMKLPEEFVKHILEQEKTSGIKENYG